MVSETKTGLVFIGLMALIVAAAVACNKKVGPPGIAKLTYGKNTEAEPLVSSFLVDEMIYVNAETTNTNGKYNLNFVVTTDSVVNQKEKGEHVINKSVDFEGVQPQFLRFSIAYPGQYKIEAILSDANGKQIDSKSGIITVTGEPAPAENGRDRNRGADRDKADDKDKRRSRDEDKDKDRK